MICDSLNIRLSSDVDVEADALVDVDVEIMMLMFDSMLELHFPHHF